MEYTRLPVSPFCWNLFVASLMIEHHDRGAFTDLAEIAEGAGLRRNRAAVHAGPDAIRSAGALRSAVIEFPHFDPAVVVPNDPLAVDRIIPIGLLRKRLVRFRPEFSITICAV